MNRALIASIIFAAGAFAFFVLALPEFTSVKNTRAALQVRQTLIEEKKVQLENVAELDRQYKSKQASIDKLTTFMPEQKRVDQIVSSIQEIAGQSGLNLVVMTTAATAETGVGAGYKKVFVSFDVVGQYPSFISFLNLLEQNLRLYDIFEIIVSPATGSGGQNLLIFSVKLNAYNLK